MRRVLASVGVLSAERLIQMGSVAAVAVVLARVLGPSTFGLYVFVVSVISLAQPLVDFGQLVFVRDLTKDPGLRAHVLGAAFRIAGAMAIVTQLLVVAFALVLPAELSAATLPLVIASFALVARPLLVFDYWFQAELRAVRAAGARIGGLVVGAGLRIVVVFSAETAFVLRWLALTVVLEALVTGALMIYFYERDSGSTRQVFRSGPPAWPYFKETLPLLVSGVSVVLYMRLDQIMLGFLASTREVGQYAAAVRLSEVSYFVPVVLMTSLAPTLTRRHLRSREEFLDLYGRLVGAFLVVSFLLAATLGLAAPWLVSFLFGPDYAYAADVLRVHIWSLPFVFLGVSQSSWNTVNNLQGLAMLRTLGGAAINTLLNFVLIPPFGALGAAYATIVAYAFAGCIGNLFSARTRPYLQLQLRQFSPLRAFRNVVWVRKELVTRLRAEPLPPSP
jgi:PST family polysaccharide transporter